MQVSHRSFLRVPFGFMLALTTWSAMSQPLPEPVSRDGVLYATGGIGIDEARAFQAAGPRYSLRLTFAMPSGGYLSDVDVTITSNTGHHVLHARTDGPFLFIVLPAGRYRILANNGAAQVTRLVTVPSRGGVQVNVTMSEAPVGARAVTPGRCQRCNASAGR
jgi:hypothetical protein